MTTYLMRRETWSLSWRNSALRLSNYFNGPSFELGFTRRWFQFGAELRTSMGEGEMCASAKIPFVSIHLSWGDYDTVYRFLGRDRATSRDYSNREYAIDFHEVFDSYIFRAVWDYDDDNQKGPRVYVRLDELLFGERDTEWGEPRTKADTVDYTDMSGNPITLAADLEIKPFTHGYSRVPRRFWQRGWVGEITFRNGESLRHPGKGTTSYNCDEDGIYSQSGPVSGPEAWDEIVQKVIESADEYRRRYPL